MWNEMQDDWDNFVIESDQAMSSVAAGTETDTGLEDKQLIDEPVDYTGSNKTVQTDVRVGQGFFRQAVLSAYDYRCCITGLSVILIF